LGLIATSARAACLQAKRAILNLNTSGFIQLNTRDRANETRKNEKGEKAPVR